MSFLLHHIEQVIAQYTGNPPLAVFLKQYCKQYPKLGSRDRKALSEAVYLYYRCRHFATAGTTIADVVAMGIIWCNSSNVFLKKIMEPVGAKYLVQPPAPVLPDWSIALSAPLIPAQWLYSLWQQPQLFIRLRSYTVTGLLQQHQVPFEPVTIPGNDKHDSLRLPNGSAIDQLLPEQDYVVQDWSSQASMYALLPYVQQGCSSVWDVCSGAGGKSILLKDKLPLFTLLATDIRESILHNLQMRFKKYALGKTETLVLNSADSEEVGHKLKDRKFDLVLCDVPCSGSGTWGRTPEQFHFFEEDDLLKFEALQYPIALNASRHVAGGGILAYVTCSVFEKENGDVVRRLVQDTDLQLLQQQLIVGIEQQADSLFIAIFRKSAG